MSTNDDFSPIIDQGDVDASASRRGRAGRSSGAEAGVARLMVGRNGTLISDASRTAGERFWDRSRRWVTVDVSPHSMQFEVPLADPWGRVDLMVSLTATVRVTDATKVVADGLREVRAHVEPAVRMAVAGVELVDLIDSKLMVKDDTQKLSVLRSATARKLIAGLMTAPLSGGVPDGLEVRISSVSVDYDQPTSEHLAALADQRRQVQRVDAEADVDDTRDERRRKRQDRWRDAFAGRLPIDPRLMELLIMDPSQENMAAVVNQSYSMEAAARAEFITVLQQLIDKDYPERGDPMYDAAVAVVANLQAGANIKGIGSSEGALPRIKGSDEDGQVLDAE